MNNPLISVVVITYNSSSTVVETLDSIYAQTYNKIELIISDDCSTDDTVQLCNDWIETHNERFMSAKILVSYANTGISANFNRAESACSAEWVKGIAGDDILLYDCIETMVEYINLNPACVCVFSKMSGFGRSKYETTEYMSRVFDYSLFDLTADEQYKRLVLKGNCIPAPTCFYNLNKFKLLGIKNDERIPMIEDYPKCLNLTRKGVKLFLLIKHWLSIVCLNHLSLQQVHRLLKLVSPYHLYTYITYLLLVSNITSLYIRG